MRGGRGGEGREVKRDVAAVTRRVIQSTGTYMLRSRKEEKPLLTHLGEENCESEMRI